MNITDRSGGTQGTIQQLPTRLATSDPVANAGRSDAYHGDGEQCDAKPADFQGNVDQAAPAMKTFQGNIGPRMAKSSTGTAMDVALDKAPVTADPSKSTGGTGVGSHPGLMAAHRHGSISRTDHRSVHGQVKSMYKPMSTAESDQGGPMPVVAKVAAETFRNAATDVPATKPVVANLDNSRPMFSRD
jgi:hypothetical protein